MPSAHPTTSSGPATTGGIPRPQSSSPTLPPPVSDLEAKCYYAGLPSAPILVARTGTTPWVMPTGSEADLKDKELRPVGNHPLREAMQGDLPPKLFSLLNSMEVKWTSIDSARIGNAEEYYVPIVLWIGVVPASLSRSDGVVVAFKCRELLVEHGITDVDVEIRESVVSRWGSVCTGIYAET
jgi:hypothetical protein